MRFTQQQEKNSCYNPSCRRVFKLGLQLCDDSFASFICYFSVILIIIGHSLHCFDMCVCVHRECIQERKMGIELVIYVYSSISTSHMFNQSLSLSPVLPRMQIQNLLVFILCEHHQQSDCYSLLLSILFSYSRLTMGTVVNDDDVQRIMSANIYPDYHSQLASLSLSHFIAMRVFNGTKSLIYYCDISSHILWR